MPKEQQIDHVALVFDDKDEMVRCLDIVSGYEGLICEVVPWRLVLMPRSLSEICQKRGILPARIVKVHRPEGGWDSGYDHLATLGKRIDQDAGRLPLSANGSSSGVPYRMRQAQQAAVIAGVWDEEERMDDTLQLMGTLAERPARMAVAAALGKRKSDVVAYTNLVLAKGRLPEVAANEVSREVRDLQALGIVDPENPSRLTERGLRIVALLLYGRHWKEHTDPAKRAIVG